MMRRIALIALIAGATACRVDALEGAAYAGPRNRCDIGCPEGSVCVDDACVVQQLGYSMVVETTPPTSSSYAPGVTFSVTIDDKRAGTRDLKLPEIAIVSARLDAETSIPLVLRLRRVGAVPGTASTTFEARSPSKAALGPPLTAPLVIPPGDYHVFVAPANDEDLAQFPPVQLRTENTGAPLVVTFPAGAHELRVAYASGTFRTLEVNLLRSDGTPLVDANEARDIRVIDETTGRLASTIAHTCRAPGEDLAPTVTLKLAPELAGHRYTLRVDPAEQSCSAATPPVRAHIDYDLQALDVEGRGGRVTLQMPVVRTAFVTGLVTAFQRGTSIDGDVILRSVQLDETVDATKGRAWSEVIGKIRDGSFKEEVLPGTYRATIIPSPEVGRPSYNFAICVDCTVPSQDPKAKPGARTAEFVVTRDTGVLRFDQVPERVKVRGSAAGFDGALFTVGTWEAAASSSEVGVGSAGTPLITRAQTGLVTVIQQKDGAQWNIVRDATTTQFAPLDPGVYDFVVRTPEASGYPWIFWPRLQVNPAAELDLGVMRASPPVVFTGRVVDPNGAPIPRATVRGRALIPASEPGKPPLGAVLVGETRADENGNYRLVVPSAWVVPKKESSG